MIFTMIRHYCLAGKCDRYMGWAEILNLWEENQRKETKAKPEDCVNCWSPLRKVQKCGLARELCANSNSQMPASWKRHLSLFGQHLFVLERRHLCWEELAGESETAWGAWKNEGALIKQRVRNCSSTATGWAGRNWWQRCLCGDKGSPTVHTAYKAWYFLIPPRQSG